MRLTAFNKILIANRGEIALRIMRTCRRLGIASVAVYSEADERSPHVRFADEAVCIGPAPARESYLSIERVLNAAGRTAADAVHPGYGFLSENADFAAACAGAGIVFIGPAPEAIRSMGLKSTARKIAAAAGVATAPGYDGDDQSSGTLRTRALEIGFPVLIKASAGGGGKGMREVRQSSELDSAIESAGREAAKAFGDGALLMEKYIENARHVEIQILGDCHGNLIHLFERDCSIQRRHQKIIEESPAPGLAEEIREKLCAAALAVGRALNYHNAGTVEFILTPTGEFYFIEVNTRLQVEHPVTEMITGLDLVELQIAIAEGKPLPMTQGEVRRAGHAIEARLYAEDPANDFLPSTGAIEDYHLPDIHGGVRIDSGIEKGQEVGIHYDPMLAKVIARGTDRESALRRLRHALSSLSVQGLRTNRGFLLEVLSHPDFAAGGYHVGFIGENMERLAAAGEGREEAAAATVLYLETERAAVRFPRVPQNYRNNPYRDPMMKLRIDGADLEVSWRQAGPEDYRVSVESWRAEVRVAEHEPGHICLVIDGVYRRFRMTEAGSRVYVHSIHGDHSVRRLPRYPEAELASGYETADSPMPGQVLRVLVEVGQRISAGDPLVVLEAMKMEQTLRAAIDGQVESVLVRAGDVVAPGDILVHIAPLKE